MQRDQIFKLKNLKFWNFLKAAIFDFTIEIFIPVSKPINGLAIGFKLSNSAEARLTKCGRPSILSCSLIRGAKFVITWPNRDESIQGVEMFYQRPNTFSMI